MSKFSALREWEILDEINKNEEQRDTLLQEWGNKTPLKYLLSLNFVDNLKLDLPEGMPPYNRDEATHSDFQGAIVHTIERLRYCFPESGLKKIKKEGIFIEILECCPPKSADILCACKDKALAELLTLVA